MWKTDSIGLSQGVHVVTDWQQRVAAGLRVEGFEEELLPPSLLLQESFGAAGSLIVALPPSSGISKYPDPYSIADAKRRQVQCSLSISVLDILVAYHRN